MADMKFVVRRRGHQVQRWDYSTHGWVDWEPGKFEAKLMGMRGHYQLMLRRRDLVLQRYSGGGKLMWDLPVPEGVAAYTAQGGGPVGPLPWEERDPLLRTARLLGFDPAHVYFHKPVEMDMQLALKQRGKTPDGRRVDQSLRTDGRVVYTPGGVRVDLPSYVVRVDEIHLNPGFKPQLVGRELHLWRSKFNGPGVAPAALLKVLHGMNLVNQMAPWEMALLRELRGKGEGA